MVLVAIVGLRLEIHDFLDVAVTVPALHGKNQVQYKSY